MVQEIVHAQILLSMFDKRGVLYVCILLLLTIPIS